MQAITPESRQRLGEIADRLAELADLIRHPTLHQPVARMRRANGHAPFLELAQQLYHMRRKRTASFGDSELFGEPAWDILLDLYIAHATGQPVSVTSACIGAAVPATTALRHLGQLQEEGLILREHDRRDQRRVLVRLSPSGVQRMENYFREILGDANHGIARIGFVPANGAADQTASAPKHPDPA